MRPAGRAYRSAQEDRPAALALVGVGVVQHQAASVGMCGAARLPGGRRPIVALLLRTVADAAFQLRRVVALDDVVAATVARISDHGDRGVAELRRIEHAQRCDLWRLAPVAQRAFHRLVRFLREILVKHDQRVVIVGGKAPRSPKCLRKSRAQRMAGVVAVARRADANPRDRHLAHVAVDFHRSIVETMRCGQYMGGADQDAVPRDRLFRWNPTTDLGSSTKGRSRRPSAGVRCR